MTRAGVEKEKDVGRKYIFFDLVAHKPDIHCHALATSSCTLSSIEADPTNEDKNSAAKIKNLANLSSSRRPA